ncbi:hypothetical protein [Streptomyces sp. NPDC049590]|uniref:hypothetical protein n=1 Tax=Streptomyces sp. NPDC049590 TaxID=3154834 RepID=UPI003416503C
MVEGPPGSGEDPAGPRRGAAGLRLDGGGRRLPGRAGGAAYRDDLGQWNTREHTDPAGGLPAARTTCACAGTPAAYGTGLRGRLRAVTP